MDMKNSNIKKRIAKPASAAPPTESQKPPQHAAEQASILKVVTSNVQGFAREEEEAKNYWKSEGVHPASYPVTPHYIPAIAEIVDTIKAEHVFEFGCGSGRNLAAFREICAARHLKCAGIDISPSLIAAGRNKFNLQIEEGDENTLQSIGDDLYDLVFTVSVLDHLPDPSIALGHLARISRGWCLFVEPHDEALQKQSLRLEKVQNRRAQKHKEKSAPYTYLHDYKALFKQHGLKIALEFSFPTHYGRSGPLYRLWLVRKMAEGVPNLTEPVLKSLHDRVLKIAFLHLLSNVQTARQAQAIDKAILETSLAKIIELRGNERELLKEATANKTAAGTAGKKLKAAQAVHDSEQKKAREALETAGKKLKAAQTAHDSERKKAREALTQAKEETIALKKELKAAQATHDSEQKEG